jgi:hypothetical protein
LLDILLVSIRRRTKERNKSIALVRLLRRLIHFGPWRVVPQFIIRQLRPVLTSHHDEGSASLLGSLDVGRLVAEIRRNSVAMANPLPLDFVKHLQVITDRLPVNHYQRVHEIDDHIRQLSGDAGIQKVLRAYFNCEPVLLECTLVITGSLQSPGLSEQNTFHLDYAGWESLNVFVYLSDVSDESAYHIVARGSHRKLGLRDMVKASLTNEEAQRRFGLSIKAITGPAGTLFFENTEAYHRRQLSGERRVMLNMLYASHRGLLSYGRSSPKHIANRARTYAQWQALTGAADSKSQ